MESSQTLTTTRDDHVVAWFAALAIGIHVVESQIPSPLPGLKPGLANVVTLLVLYRYGWRCAAWVSFLRVTVGSLMIGSFLSPTFFLSFSGALAAILVLFLLARIPDRWISPVGLGTSAALAHMATQFFVAYHMFIPHAGIWVLFPVLMTMALVFGITSGMITTMLLKGLNHE